MFTYYYLYTIGGTEYRTALISAVSLGVALLICLIGSITVIVLLTILLIRSKSKVGTVVVNSTVSLDQVASRTTSESVSQSSRISTKKNISYVVHSPKTDPDV